MNVETHDRLGNPRKVKATRVLVTDDTGNPLACLVQLGPGHIRMCHVDQADFLDSLREMGVLDTVVVSKIDTSSLRPPRLEG